MIPRRTLGAAVIAVLPLAAACGVGRNTTTDKERQTPYVASASAGSLLVTAASLVPSQAGSTGSSATSSPTPSAGNGSGAAVADAYLVVAIVNRGKTPDQLTGVQVPGASVNPVDVSQQALTLPPSQAVTFGVPDSNNTSANVLQVSNLSQPLTTGTSVPVTFQFRNAGSVTLQVLVRDDIGTTATSTPLPLTGSYPSTTETPEGLPTGG